ncbi:Alpha/beta hydrolase fold-1 [Colletotrichum godetiae]|uniref:Alpha/beta hydrolase fold-1 n=1 Tax=Colletotrichum godetiae TaxID=1209918 RepID=A0AAJ0ANS1_9PEZI|nr:Alpha/beta hydrolase fold-1 [Colletotrichum godetiae]KAK1687607.1 Alpha/beta hydrolase fold-1 [Colletotrichum godetiae]
MSSKPVIVLTPGAWHSPEHFQDFRDELHTRGWETHGVRNQSVGSEPPTKGLYDDAAATAAVLQELADQGKQIVLIAHSYGGLAAAEGVKGFGIKQRTAEGKPGGVIMFVYLAAFVGQKGQSILSLTGDVYPPWTKVEDGRILLLATDEPFYGDVPSEAREKAKTFLKHQTTVSFEEAVTYEPWHDVTCMYVGCEDDQAIPYFAQEKMQELLGPTATKLKLKSAHSPFLSMVTETADAVELAAKKGLESL